MDKYYVRSEISNLLHPRQISKSYLKHTKSVENLYPSEKRAPLGHAPTPNIPYKCINMTFGDCTPKDSNYENNWREHINILPENVIDFYSTNASVIGECSGPMQAKWLDTSDFKDSASKYENDWREHTNILPENVIDFYSTSASVIGDHKYSASKYENEWREHMDILPVNVIDFYSTSASVIGDHEYSVRSKTAGLPSYNIETDCSSLKGVSEFRKYVDGPSAIQPNAFLKRGVSEKDLRKQYSKKQIKSILDASGVRVSHPAFEEAWKRAECGGKSSLEHVWLLLRNECLSDCRHF